jgi:predicted transcriptional regulator
LPLLKAPPKQPKSATIQIRVEEDVKLRLEKYAEFIDSSPAYVVTEALQLLFKKDEEFKSWLGQHTNNDNLNQIEGASLTEIAKKA